MILLRKISSISLLITLASFIAACATAPPRNAFEIAEDNKIELAVIQKLADDPNIYARHIEVSVRRGVVTLSGFVFEPGELFQAIQIAASVPGVTTVNDQMELEVFGRGGRGGGGGSS